MLVDRAYEGYLNTLLLVVSLNHMRCVHIDYAIP